MCYKRAGDVMRLYPLPEGMKRCVLVIRSSFTKQQDRDQINNPGTVTGKSQV